MAVAYLHRLVITGPREAVDLFRRQIRHSYMRSVLKREWLEVIPFSFQRLYELVPAAVQIEPVAPYDPYGISVWRVRRLTGKNAEIRYRMHTRNLELWPFIRLLSKKCPALEFVLMTDCECEEITSYLMHGGRVRRWRLPQSRIDAHWELVRKVRLTDEEMFDDYSARDMAEEAVRVEAQDHWAKVANTTPPQRDRNWFGQPVWHDLESERTIIMAELAAKEAAEKRSANRGPRRKKK